MTALVYCNGAPLNDNEFTRYLAAADLLIAADGGAYAVFEHGACPQVIIGDLDSFTQAAPDGVLLIHDPDQESNDLQKALTYARTQGASEVRVAGALGGRLDHELNNLSVLLEFSPRFGRLEFVNGFGRHFIAPPDLRLELPTGKVVSLFPLNGRVDGISTEGLAYPLRNESLENGVRNGCLNKTSAESIRVTHASGALLVSVEN